MEIRIGGSIRCLSFLTLLTILAAAAFTAWQVEASAQVLKPIDTAEVDPAMLKDFYGTYEIRDKTGRRKCRVVLKPDVTIGGSEIVVAPGCERTFPIMGEVTAWRLYENWTIGFADATRKLLIRFSTPDARYIAQPETDGIDTIVQISRVQITR